MSNSGRGRTQGGFTLLELLTVVAVVSILAVVSLPIYFDYATRAQVTEGIAKMGEFKTRVTETYYGEGAFPISNSDAGMSDPEDYATDKITQISIGTGGVITVEYDIAVLGTDNRLDFQPSVNDVGVNWTCLPAATNGIEDRYIPSECRTDTGP